MKRPIITLCCALALALALADLPTYTATAHAFGLPQSPADRFGSDLVCTAADVSITNIAVVSGSLNSCIGGSDVTLDLDLTVNFAVPDRYDVGIFIANDGKDPQVLSTNGGAASCTVAVLPTSNPFLNLDPGPDKNGIADTCGDGDGSIGGGTGAGHLIMNNVTVSCRALGGSAGNLYIPFVVSWDNSATTNRTTTGTCTSAADPVPNTKSKCNAPLVTQGTVAVVVLPTISKTDGLATLVAGDATTYTVVIANTTGDTLSGAVFTDPAVADLTANSVACSATGGATCPAITVAAMQGAGVTIPAMPANSSVTFTIDATVSAAAPAGTLTNTATITVAGQSNSASDVNTVLRKPTFTVKKQSNGGTGSFAFTGINGVGSFSLDTAAANPQTSATYTATAVNTQTTITETNPAGWNSTSASCSDGAATFGSLAGGTLTIPAANVAYNKDIVCTFTNDRLTIPLISLLKTVQTISDPVNGAANPFAIPGAEMLYSIVVSNSGAGAADSDTVIITDPLDTKTALVVTGTPVAFIDGTPSSGLTFSFGGMADLTDDVAFSSDGGNTWNYIPVPDGNGTDTNVTHLRIIPKGPLAAASGTGDPGFEVRFKVRIR